MIMPWDVEPLTMLGFAVRATVVLATGLVLAWLVRKDSAQSRHRLWTATLFVLLLLPPVALWAPAWQLPLLPSHDAVAAGTPAVASTDVALAGPRKAADPGMAADPPMFADPGTADASGIRPASAVRSEGVVVEPGPSRRAEVQPAAWTGVVLDTEDAAHFAGSPASPSFPLPHPLLVWAIGCLAGLIVVAAGLLRWRMLIRRGTPVEDPLWVREMHAIACRLGLRRSVRLVASDAATTPMTGGVRRPVILLPASSAAWDAERRRVVLMHEMVHVRRCDALRQLMRGVVLALYWFHPLAWVAARLAATSREEACDERVLQLGSRPSEYARHLMSLAATRAGYGPAPLAALSLVQRSRPRLERRIMAILRPHRPRTSALVTGALLAVTGLLGVSAAIAHPVPRVEGDAGVIAAEPVALLTAGDGETPAAPVRTAGPPPETSASDAGVDESVAVSLTGVPAGGKSVVRESPEDVSMTDGPGALQTSRLQEVECVSPSSVAEDFGAGDAVDVTGLDGEDLAGALIRVSKSGGGSYPDGDRVAWASIDDVRLCMRVHGDVELGASEDHSIAADGWILLESEGERLHRLIIRPGDGGLEHEWNVGGESRPFDELAREWRDGMLAVLKGTMEIYRIRGEESELQDRISRRRGAVSELEGQATYDRGVVAGLQSQVAYRQSVVADLLNQISYHQEVLSGMRDEIAYHRGVVSGMRDEIAMHRDRVAAFEEVKSSYEAQITAIIPRLKTASSAERQQIEETIKAWEDRIRGTVEQIQAYGLNARVQKIETGIRNYGLDARVRSVEQQIVNHEQRAGLEEIEAAIEEQSKLLDEVTRRTEQAITARETRIRDTGQEIAVSTSPDDEVARLEQQLRGLDADGTVALIEQLIEDVSVKLLELIRQL